MADKHEDQHATMDMSEHLRTWRMFVSMLKWNLLGVGVLMLLLLAFRAHNG
jgi:hypothetical protein